MHVPDFSAWSPETWSAAGTLGTMAIALVAAMVALRQVGEARRLRLEQAQPYVIVDLQASRVWENVILLVVENIGRTAAHDVKLDFDPPIATTIRQPGYDLKEAAFLKTGIPSLPPGGRVSAIFDYSHDRYKSDLPMKYEVTVKCVDHKRNSYEPMTYVLDWTIFYGIMRMTEYGVHAGVKALRAIDESLQHMASRGLDVWSRDGDEKDAKARERTQQQQDEYADLKRALGLSSVRPEDIG